MEQDRISQVRQRAHAIWIEQGQPEGAAHDHWAQAEAEFESADGAATSATGAETAPEPSETVPGAAIAPDPAPLAAPEIVATPEPAAEPTAAATPQPAKKPVRRRAKS